MAITLIRGTVLVLLLVLASDKGLEVVALVLEVAVSVLRLSVAVCASVLVVFSLGCAVELSLELLLLEEEALLLLLVLLLLL